MSILPFIEEQQLADMYTWMPKVINNMPVEFFDYDYTYDKQDTSRNPPDQEFGGRPSGSRH